MKYLISLALLLVLVGCENNPGGSQDSNRSASKNATSYLDGPLRGMVNQRGLYKLVRSGGVVDDPQTSTGKAVTKPVVQQVKSTERIPLIRGAQMYLQYRIWYLPDRPVHIDLRQVLKHPEMKLPDGTVSTGSDFTTKGKVSVNQAIGYIGYGFDEDYELVEGEWVFELWYKNKKLIEQKFTTYWPDQEELAALETLLAPNRRVGVITSSEERPWPRVVIPVEEDQDPEPAESSIEP